MTDLAGGRISVGKPIRTTALGQLSAGVRRTPDGEVEVGVLSPRPDLVATSGAPEHLRFLAGRAADIGGPTLVAVRELIEENGVPHLVTDPVPEGNLVGWFAAEGTLFPSAVVQLGAEIALALGMLHRAGIAHLAVTPENVVYAGRGARLTGQCVAPVPLGTPEGRDALTLKMASYFAPEVLRGHDAGAPADLYSLGVILYQAVCGVPPYTGHLHEIIQGHLEKQSGRPPSVPDSLWKAITALLDKTPAARPTAEQAARMLDELVDPLSGIPAGPRLHTPPPPVGQPPPIPVPMIMPTGVPVPRRRGRWVAVGLTVAVGTVTAVWLLGSPGTTAPSGPGSQGGPGGRGGGVPAAASSTPTPVITTTSELRVMPDLTGSSLTDAVDALPRTITVETTPEYAPETPDGTVIGQSPKPGEPISGAVRLTIAQGLAEELLAEKDPVAGAWGERSNTIKLGGKEYPYSLAAAVSGCYDSTQGSIEYDLSNDYRKLTLTAGMDDKSQDSEVTTRLEILGDGQSLKTVTVKFRDAQEIDVDVTGVVRLQLRWQVPPQESNCWNASLVLGFPRLHGFSEEMTTAPPTTS
jgi:hypothetical protein